MTSIEKISRYINSSPFDFTSASFIQISTDYEIDPGFALATFLWETGSGTSDPWIDNNNPAGIRCGTDYCSYESEEQGITAMFELLDVYIDTYNLRTIDAIRSRWSEANDSDDVAIMWKQIIE